ncbi:ABC transporter permease [Pseudothermotoga thermarum]|uniref:Binding-protein-dependent transport systems inner membrane component n=1 Tax=Pseudothermotoga thermarum DSM 5069 TaxID=688269 RepID=F7YVM1_9THEM|nr:ABC transporter permease [Pseudothermotoga thermarum]AEH51682.1 binding-protein-dependent transport systems inner membrane component [Pseudothermotoga thermarum DSM 5069]
MKKSGIIVEIIFAIALVLLWQYAPVPSYILPKPTRILSELLAQRSVILNHLKITLYEAVSGLFIALCVGVFSAILMYLVKIVAKILLPLIVITQTIPITVIAPLIVIWFGFGISAKIGTVAFLCFFPIAINTYEALKTVDPQKLELLKAYKAKWYQRLRFLYIPHTLPHIFSGLKIAVTYAFTAAILAEWMGAQAGLGVYTIRALNSFRVDRVFVVVTLTIIITLVLFFIIDRISRKIAPWAYRGEGGMRG